MRGVEYDRVKGAGMTYASVVTKPDPATFGNTVMVGVQTRDGCIWVAGAAATLPLDIAAEATGAASIAKAINAAYDAGVRDGAKGGKP